MNRKFLAFTSVLILINNLVFAGCALQKQEISESKSLSNFQKGSEPSGFRGIKWETDISALSGMEYLETNPNYVGGLKIYTKKGDDLRIGGAELVKIKYGFWRGKFYGVTVYTKGYENWLGLKNATFEQFGKSSYGVDTFEETYCWFGDIAAIIMGYDEIDKEGKLSIFSAEMNKEAKIKEKF